MTLPYTYKARQDAQFERNVAVTIPLTAVSPTLDNAKNITRLYKTMRVTVLLFSMLTLTTLCE